MPRQTSNTSSGQSRRNFSNTSPTIYERKISTSQTPSVIHSHQTIDVQQPGIVSTMKQGIGLGMGSELGHRLMGSFLGPTQMQTQHLPPAYQNLYMQCVKKNEDFPEICKPFLTKDPSPWKQCMEKQNFNHLECSQ